MFAIASLLMVKLAYLIVPIISIWILFDFISLILFGTRW